MDLMKGCWHVLTLSSLPPQLRHCPLYKRRAFALAEAVKRGLQRGESKIENMVDNMYTSSKCSSGQWQYFIVNGSASDAVCDEVAFVTKGLRCVPSWIWLRERVC